MANEIILIEYKAKIDQLEKSLDTIEADLKDVEKEGKKSFKTVETESKKAAKGVSAVSKETTTLSSTFKNLGSQIAGVFAVGSIISFGKSVIDITAEFQKFEAVLTNTLGSRSRAMQALTMIKDFAAKTPFSVQELTSSFVKLANQGFKPTSDEMRKLGDLAASQGKSFDMLTEAIIDGQTGEFERLKEFGIRASKEGDKVKFTFKGVKTEVDFTNESIRNYILGLGDAAGVSGSMEAVSKTLGGQISNLGDKWDSLLNTIGSGNTGILSTAADKLGELLDFFNDVATTADQKNQKNIQTRAAKAVEMQKASLEAEKKLRIEAGQEVLEWEKSFVKEMINIREREANEEFEKVRKPFQNKHERFNHEVRANELVAEKEFFQDRLKAIEDGNNAEIESNKKKDEENKKLRDKEFQTRLKNLDQLEKLKLLEAKNQGKNEGDLIKIQENFQKQRIHLYLQYLGKHKTETKLEVEELKALEIEFTNFLKEEADKKGKIHYEQEIKPYIDAERAKYDELEKLGKEAGKKNQEMAKAQAEKEAADKKKQREDIQEQTLSESIQFSNELFEAINQNELNKKLEAIDIEKQALEKQTADQLAQLDVRLKAGKTNDEQAARQREVILAAQKKKEDILKVKAFEAQKTADIRAIEINAIVGIAKTFAQMGFTPAGLIAVAALTASSIVGIAEIRKKKPPKFAKGGEIGGKSHSEGGTLIEAENGEYVINKNSYSKHSDATKAINGDYFDKYVNKEYLSPIIKKQEESFRREKKMMEDSLKAIAANTYQSNTEHIERLLKSNKNINLNNVDTLAKKIGKEFRKNDEMK
jgi:hypothetical protein